MVVLLIQVGGRCLAMLVLRLLVLIADSVMCTHGPLETPELDDHMPKISFTSPRCLGLRLPSRSVLSFVGTCSYAIHLVLTNFASLEGWNLFITTVLVSTGQLDST